MENDTLVETLMVADTITAKPEEYQAEPYTGNWAVTLFFTTKGDAERFIEAFGTKSQSDEEP